MRAETLSFHTQSYDATIDEGVQGGAGASRRRHALGGAIDSTPPPPPSLHTTAGALSGRKAVQTPDAVPRCPPPPANSTFCAAEWARVAADAALLNACACACACALRAAPKIPSNRLYASGPLALTRPRPPLAQRLWLALAYTYLYLRLPRCPVYATPMVYPTPDADGIGLASRCLRLHYTTRPHTLQPRPALHGPRSHAWLRDSQPTIPW